MGKSRRFTFNHRQRLHGNRAFSEVFTAQMRKNLGPIVVCGKPNGLGYNRLGLSVPRRVGMAVVRAGIKRRLREAFRLSQHDVQAGYDLVVVVRPHERLTVAEYQALLCEGVGRIHALAVRRSGKADGPTT